MNEIKINSHAGPYSILIENDALNYSGELLGKRFNECKVCIISDDIVSKIYLEIVKDSLQLKDFQVFDFIIKSGESSKSLPIAYNLYDFLSTNFFTRSDLVIALGGGVVGDVAGFVASTYLRGIKSVNIPTTLLAQIDSSVGGKTGVNLPAGKNMVGSIYPASLVIVDPKVLKTLTKSDWACGMSEAIKYAMIKDKFLFDKIKNENIEDFLSSLICRCIEIKKCVVEEDEFDNKDRMLLNFGHTLGHAIEKLGNYEKLSHGQAVSLGMKMITQACVENNIADEKVLKDLVCTLKKFELPTSCDFSKKEIAVSALNDKKIVDEKINVALVDDIGSGFMYKFSKEHFLKFILGEEICVQQ